MLNDDAVNPLALAMGRVKNGGMHYRVVPRDEVPEDMLSLSKPHEILHS